MGRGGKLGNGSGRREEARQISGQLRAGAVASARVDRVA